MRCLWLVVGGLWCVVLASCGVPREAWSLAGREEAVLGAVAEDDAAVRGALVAQADAWDAMADLVQRQDAFGTPVNGDFIGLVRQTAALARRQRELIERGEDDAGLNRQTLAQLRRIWSDARRYLGE
jgi:hypothetical protein